ncbi:MAG: aminomethyl transferase family protein [Armatimonadota bacterium]|nr:aminomethyl transferase family protein [Armatimonadota bacterium]MDR7444842.1 aminomethyl transferase family protein [Armatimonadota bacterium]MDR7570008.1 aminomethyl transferase family protein [Armatimonadota bacterium]MDR7615172.1 aminomethyl transferase family protein [Armatimonadota bacterium]
MGSAGPRNLQEILEQVPNITDYLYNNRTGARAFPVVPAEFTNWRDEQHAWRETVALLDLSYHMSDLYVYGPDALPLLNFLGINSFRGFEPGQAKQLVVCSPEGYVIGDAVLFYLEPEVFQLVGRPSALNWVQYHGETGGYRVRFERDEWSLVDPHRPRRVYRFQLQGPLAPALLEALNGGPLPDVKFFHMAWLQIRGRRARFLHHGMAGVAGGEIFGPWEDREAVREAILEAGEAFGLRQVGSRAYATNTLESGWISGVLPAIYTSPALRAYREWLPATSYEATGSLGGSFYSPNIEDYYLTPWDLGYGHILKFDHDFIGREALERKVGEPHRQKVTLVWHPEDVTGVFRDLFTKPKGERAKYMDLPVPRYCMWPYDKVLNRKGECVGFSTSCGYSSNEGAMLSLAMVEEAYRAPGTEVIVVWGEPDGGSRKPSVERHVQVEIRATVGPVPYSQAAREYRTLVRGRR